MECNVNQVFAIDTWMVVNLWLLSISISHVEIIDPMSSQLTTVPASLFHLNANPIQEIAIICISMRITVRAQEH